MYIHRIKKLLVIIELAHRILIIVQIDLLCSIVMGCNHSVEDVIIEQSPLDIVIQRYELQGDVDWDAIFSRYRFDTNDIVSHDDIIDWNSLCKYHPMPLSFINRIRPQINFDALSENKYLNDEIVRTFINKLEFIKIAQSKSISQTYAEELLLASNTNHVAPLLQYYLFSDWALMQLNVFKLDEHSFHVMAKYQDMGDSCLLHFKYHLDWHTVCRYQFITCQFIKENPQLIKWKSLSRNKCLSSGVVVRFRSRLTETREVRNALNNSTIELISNSQIAMM